MNFLLGIAVQLLSSLFLIRLLLQAVQADFYNPLSQTVFKLSAPVVEPLSRLLPSIGRLNCAALAAALGVRFGYFLFAGASPVVALLQSSYGLLVLLMDLYFWAIFIIIIASWVGNGSNPLLRVIAQLVEPYMGVFRRFIPPLGMLDLSPMAAILVLISVRDRLLPMLFNALQGALL
ncbi:YggT family protein [Gammaproteobacteria bacterium LSUCC0057]|uniref:YggT family protein n=1 Tax=Gammaproteobacteria bacterium LSUCC0057 TaxID=2559237 RepID=A0A4Y8UK04_9GAMM|nr:YggT family protein [Gammaproteobacteria bacterium LSUCC0057]